MIDSIIQVSTGFMMLKRFLSLFGVDQDGKPGEETQDAEAIRLATCVLLWEMVKSDDHVAPEEIEMVKTILLREFNLTDEEMKQLIEEAERDRAQSSGLYQYTRYLNNALSKEDRIRLVEHLWAVVYADGVLNGFEDHLVHRLAELLHLDHRHLIAAKIKVKNANHKKDF